MFEGVSVGVFDMSGVAPYQAPIPFEEWNGKSLFNNSIAVMEHV